MSKSDMMRLLFPINLIILTCLSFRSRTDPKSARFDPVCRQIRALQPEHALQPAAVGGQEGLRHGRSHHRVRDGAGSARGCVPGWTWCKPGGVNALFLKRAALPGEALLESNAAIDFVYCSPSLRCVQTAQSILKGEPRRRGADVAPVCRV